MWLSLARALDWGSRDRGFKSHHSDNCSLHLAARMLGSQPSNTGSSPVGSAVAVAQLVERLVVAQEAVGSYPIGHPNTPIAQPDRADLS